jgi:hypothetical protein
MFDMLFVIVCAVYIAPPPPTTTIPPPISVVYGTTLALAAIPAIAAAKPTRIPPPSFGRCTIFAVSMSSTGQLPYTTPADLRMLAGREFSSMGF